MSAVPASMLAAVYRGTGAAAEVLRLEERQVPRPGRGEVLVRVTVSGVNPTDWKTRAGESTVGPEQPFQIPNQDGAGVIEAVGTGVDEARVGQRVWLYFAAWRRPWGTAAQYTVVPAERAVPLPDAAGDELGASLGIPALTAHRCLFADGSLDGRTVLVTGGAGAVGRAAIELARWSGARVVATVSNADKAALARAAGAGAVVDYHAADAADQLRDAAPGGVDRIVDVSVETNLELDLAAAAPHCDIAAYATAGRSPKLDVRALMVRNITLRFVYVYTVPGQALRAAVDDITTALHEGALTTPPLHRFPLAQAAEAHDAVEAGAVGKVVIDVP